MSNEIPKTPAGKMAALETLRELPLATPSLSNEIISFIMALAARTANGVGVQSITLAKPLYRRLAADAALYEMLSPPATYRGAVERARPLVPGPMRLEMHTPVGSVVILEGE